MRRAMLMPCMLLQWLNKALEEMWPFYDYAVCEMIKVRYQLFLSVLPSLPADA